MEKVRTTKHPVSRLAATKCLRGTKRMAENLGQKIVVRLVMPLAQTRIYFLPQMFCLFSPESEFETQQM
jgi:hypothetical protein